MGWWQVNADTLARVRFVVSPLAEAIACLKTLERATAAHPGEVAWLAAHLPAYRKRLSDDPITALLVKAALGRAWNATFLTPTPTGGDEPTFQQELTQIRATPPGTARADLTVSLGGPLPARLQRSDLPERAAGLLEWVWEESVLPYWPRRHGIIKADIVARTAKLSDGGWAAVLDGMRPGMRWLGESRLQITMYDHPPRELFGAQLMLVPVTPHQTWVSWDVSPRDVSRRHAVVYPCSGALTEPDGASAPESLSRLLGPARARMLILLETPKSTTQLVSLTGQGLGSVGRHLRILLDAGLIHRRRAGRYVLYYRSGAGDTLAEAQRKG